MKRAIHRKHGRSRERTMARFQSEYTAIDLSHTAHLSSHTQFEKWHQLQSCSLICARGIYCCWCVHPFIKMGPGATVHWCLCRFLPPALCSSSLLCALHGVEKVSGALWGIRAASIAVALRSPRCWSGAASIVQYCALSMVLKRSAAALFSIACSCIAVPFLANSSRVWISL